MSDKVQEAHASSEASTGIKLLNTHSPLLSLGARIEQQMREFDTALSFGYEDMFRRFKTLRETLDSDLPHSNEEARPSSKCRVRLEDAKKFSETNYPD